jgi:hypothetical protein
MTLIPIFTAGGATWVEKKALLYDTFKTDDAAPISSPRTCEPGPGLLVITDTENKFSIVDGELVCAGGKTAPAYGDPGVWLGNTGPAAYAMAAGYGALFVVTPTADTKLSKFGFDDNTSGFTKNPSFQLLNDTLAVSVSAGYETVTPWTSGTEKTFIQVLRSNTHGSFFIDGGKLLNVNNDAIPMASGYVAVSNYNASLNISDLALLPLADYNPAWGGDWSEVLASDAAPADTNVETFSAQRAGATHIQLTITRNDPIGSANFIRIDSTADVNSFYLGDDGTTGRLRLYDYGTSSYLYNLFGGLPAGVTTVLDLVILPTGAFTLFKDKVLATSGTLSSTANTIGKLTSSCSDAGETQSDLAVHPYPALGIATSRVVCPQDDDTATHEADCVVEFKNITLPTSGSSVHYLRKSGTDYVYIRFEDGGEVLARNYINDAFDSLLFDLAPGTVSDSDDVVLVLDGASGELFVNGSSVATSSSFKHLTNTGYLARGMVDGTYDHIAFFPRDVSGLLPKGTF